MAEVAGRRLLDWTVAAFHDAGLTDICFIGGYQIDKVKRDYPQRFTGSQERPANYAMEMELAEAARGQLRPVLIFDVKHRKQLAIARFDCIFQQFRLGSGHHQVKRRAQYLQA